MLDNFNLWNFKVLRFKRLLFPIFKLFKHFQLSLTRLKWYFFLAEIKIIFDIPFWLFFYIFDLIRLIVLNLRKSYLLWLQRAFGLRSQKKIINDLDINDFYLLRIVSFQLKRKSYFLFHQNIFIYLVNIYFILYVKLNL